MKRQIKSSPAERNLLLKLYTVVMIKRMNPKKIKTHKYSSETALAFTKQFT